MSVHGVSRISFLALHPTPTNYLSHHFIVGTKINCVTQHVSRLKKIEMLWCIPYSDTPKVSVDEYIPFSWLKSSVQMTTSWSGIEI
jgi:hypothetical protein